MGNPKIGIRVRPATTQGNDVLIVVVVLVGEVDPAATDAAYAT
jgi:hypothetical protein